LFGEAAQGRLAGSGPLSASSATLWCACILAWSRQTLTLKKLVSPSRHWPSCWMRWVTARRRLVTAMALEVKRSSGVLDQVPTMVEWLSAAMTGAPYC
jgi:hypothetical protein